MRAKRPTVAVVLLTAVVLAVGAIALGIAVRSRHAPGVSPGLVPASWIDYRTSPGHQSHLATGKVVCRDCHDYERDGFKNAGTAPCGRCHEKQLAHTHAGAADKRTDCLSCHVFSPYHGASACMGCHAQAQGSFGAIENHAREDCAKCHRIHEPRPVAAADCVGCHEGQRAAKHAAHPGSRDCLDCHGAHTPALAAVATCSGCHQRAVGPQPPGHKACVSCHLPHDFDAGGARVCLRCHGPKPALLATQVAAHGDCLSCHAPHSPTNAADSCRDCHGTIQVAHGGKGACNECHGGHPSDPTRAASTCTSCHGNVAASDMSAHAAKTACESCHRRHDFARVDKRDLCATCHAREVTLASTNTGHADCASCHGASLAHAPARSPPCATCHASERATAPAGHAKCDACHEPHSAKLQPGADCVSCHANKTGGPHAAIKSGCIGCHRAHGPGGVASPPPCGSCHARDSLPALHATAGHAECAACHDSHNPPKSTRTTCTSRCHMDKRSHQPAAPLCAGCHGFRR